jgi:hypothetical protein
MAHPGIESIQWGIGDAMQVVDVEGKVVGTIGAIDLVFVNDRIAWRNLESCYMAHIVDNKRLASNPQ